MRLHPSIRSAIHLTRGTLCLSLLLNLLPIANADDLDGRVARVLKETPLIDGHNDIPWQYRQRVNNHLAALDLASDLTTLENPTHTDIPRLRRGGVGGLFFSVYVPVTTYGGSPVDVQKVIEQIDLVKRLVNYYGDDFGLALTASDVRKIHASGRIASLIGMEGGHSMNNSLATLRGLYDLGARYMTLTHSKGLLWADSATDEARHGGLTRFGEAVVLEMNRLGMLVDLSHVSADTMRDTLAVSKAPIIFSHSSAYAVTQHDRNVPDDVLRMVRENEGVVMVNYLTSYVSEPRRLYEVEVTNYRNSLDQTLSEDAVRAAVNDYREAHPAPEVTLFDVADHIDHIRTIAGIDAIGLGADYDGMPPGPTGLEDVSTYPALLKELLIRGYSDRDIAKIAGENVLRVLEKAESVAARLQETTAPNDALIDELDAP